ncbi:MAG: class I SAM-dependent methyltransferase [Bacteroidetes bacterium]|nr:class I SAM-dependent methyltransferase [Bacteroidota bacterium]
MNNLKLIIKYFKYRITANSKHDIHSPFVFQLLTKVINNKSVLSVFKEVENLRSLLLKDKTEIRIEDFGAGSLKNKTKIKTVAKIARNAAKQPKYAQLLYRLVKHFQPVNLLELGTSLGISTAYMSKASSTNKITTIEGSENIANIAIDNFNRLNISNIQVITGNFDVQLPVLLEHTSTFDFVFFDGNHRKQPTLSYFEACLQHKHNDSIFVFDDIHWSLEMEEVWELIKQSPEVTVTIDLFFIGLVFFRKESTKEHFTIRF